MMSALAILLVSFAVAAAPDAPVLYTGDTRTAVIGVAARAHVNEWDLQPVVLSDLVREKGFFIIGVGQPSSCTTRRSGMHEVHERLELARARLSSQQPAEALRDLDAAAAQLACLDEQAEAATLAELYYLAGLADLELDNRPAARVAFSRALSFRKDLSCDPAQPREICRAFDQLVAELQQLPTGRLRIGPGVAESAVYVDGRKAVVQGGEVILTEGTHLVQIVRNVEDATLVTSLDVTIRAGDGGPMIINSSAVTDDKLRSPEIPENWALLEGLLTTSFPSQQVYLWTGSRAYAARGAELQALPEPPEDRTALRRGLLVGGATATGVGLALVGVGLPITQPTLDLDEWEALTDREKLEHISGERFVIGGSVVAGLGLSAVGAGAILPGARGGGALALVPSLTGGQGATLTWTVWR